MTEELPILREQIQQPTLTVHWQGFYLLLLISYELGVVKEYEPVHLANQVINRISPALPVYCKWAVTRFH